MCCLSPAIAIVVVSILLGIPSAVDAKTVKTQVQNASTEPIYVGTRSTNQYWLARRVTSAEYFTIECMPGHKKAGRMSEFIFKGDFMERNDCS